MEFIFQFLSNNLSESLLLSLFVFGHFQVVDKSFDGLSRNFGYVSIVVDYVLSHIFFLQ